MARAVKRSEVKESSKIFKGGSSTPPKAKDYQVIEGGLSKENTDDEDNFPDLPKDSDEQVAAERKRVYKHRNIGVADGMAALFFAIFGQVVKDGQNNVMDGYMRFPNSATDAIDAYFGTELDETNSEIAEICVNEDGEEYFRTLSDSEIIRLFTNKHLTMENVFQPKEQLAFDFA